MTTDEANRPSRRARLSRRAILRASGASVGVLGLAVHQAGAHEDHDHDDGHGHDGGHGHDHEIYDGECPEPTVSPSMVHYDHSLEAVCSDDHPATEALQAEVREALERRFPTVGALIEDGYLPYFDLFSNRGPSGWSHWINPEYIADDRVMDPERPESVLVDHQWWRPIGVMYVAVQDDEPVESPPAVYETDGGETCVPWHAHAGLPGRYAWAKYQRVWAGDSRMDLELPCMTPWMLHVWTYPHPTSIYAHAAPPQEDRGGPPAEPAGFETSVDPQEEPLSPEVLPDAVKHRKRHAISRRWWD